MMRTVYSGNYLAHIGNLQGLLYAVHSDSDISVIGGTTVVGKGDMIGARLIVPLSQEEGFYQSLTRRPRLQAFRRECRLRRG